MPAEVHPEEVAPGVHRLATGRGITGSNVYFVRSAGSWTLIDTAWPRSGAAIRAAAEELFGPGTKPASILLTHVHPDHCGSALELARRWEAAVLVHPDEIPLVGGDYHPEYSNPLDRWLVVPLMRVLPKRKVGHAIPGTSLADVTRPFDPTGPVPGLPDWTCVPTPGHTPGHVAFFREADRVLITGDAVLNMNVNSLWALLRGSRQLSGPPYISSWNWQMAKASVAALAKLEPRVLGTGHGAPMADASTARALHDLAERLNARAHRRRTGTAGASRRGEGLFKPVDYARRARYRRPPSAYLRVSGRLGPLATTLGLSPRDVVTLEVPGRQSGVIRRTTMVRVACAGDHYVVALAGESEWVRNVRAAGGRVVIGRRERHAATLLEVPAQARAPVIRAYLLRWGRRACSSAVAKEARHFFGVSADLSLEEIAKVAEHYPVFRISYDGRPDSRRGWGR